MGHVEPSAFPPRPTRRQALRLVGGGLVLGTSLQVLSACSPAPAPVAPTAAPPKPAQPPAPAATTAPTAPPATAVAKPAAPTATAAPAVKAPLEKVALLASWKIDGARAPWLLAAKRGYFRDQGIEFEIIEGQGSSQVAKVVGAGTTPLGEIDGGVLIQSVAAAVPIKGVAAVLPLGTIAVMVPRKLGAKAPKDLEGKKLAGVAGSAAEEMFPGWMRANGADPTKVEMAMLSVSVKNTTLLQGQVDGAFGYATGDLLTLTSRGLDAVAIRYADFGFNLPALSIVANTGYLKEKPELIKRFLAAGLKGWSDSQKDVDASMAALMERPAAQTLDATQEKATLVESLKYISTKRTEAKPIGYVAVDDWKEAIDVLAKHAGLNPVPRVEDVVSTEFVSAA